MLTFEFNDIRLSATPSVKIRIPLPWSIAIHTMRRSLSYSNVVPRPRHALLFLIFYTYIISNFLTKVKFLIFKTKHKHLSLYSRGNRCPVYLGACRVVSSGIFPLRIYNEISQPSLLYTYIITNFLLFYKF